MLARLRIENYELIAEAEVEFAVGATIFTGETGSGKTMLLGALGVGLGARAGSDAVRRGAQRAVVTILFDPDEALRGRLQSDGYGLDPGEEASIVREIGPAGRSSARVNGRPATAAYLREIAVGVAEIVGQHEAQRLLSPAYHLDLLDRFAGDAALQLRSSVAVAAASDAAARAALERLMQDERAARHAYDEARLVVAEIDAAGIDPGELEPLRQRRTYLEHAERIARALDGAREALVGDERGAVAALGAAAAALGAIGSLGSRLSEMAQRAVALQSEAGDLASGIAREMEAAEFDAEQLETINARLAGLERLQRRYGGDLGALLERARSARRTVDEFESRDARLETLRAQAVAAREQLERLGARLSDVRRAAATALRERVLAEFAELALGAGIFEAALAPAEGIGPTGADRAEFLFAANAGEGVRPLARVASGGELSRVLLALVVVLARARERGSALIFDEIDAGVGGATATAVGARIGELAQSEQVVCVTHLAQIATWAQRHYVLDKLERAGETTIAVRELTGRAAREREIARMLSGEPHDAALRHARALLVRAGAGG